MFMLSYIHLGLSRQFFFLFFLQSSLGPDKVHVCCFHGSNSPLFLFHCDLSQSRDASRPLGAYDLNSGAPPLKGSFTSIQEGIVRRETQQSAAAARKNIGAQSQRKTKTARCLMALLVSLDQWGHHFSFVSTSFSSTFLSLFFFLPAFC